jgi:hypothetical protein
LSNYHRELVALLIKAVPFAEALKLLKDAHVIKMK